MTEIAARSCKNVLRKTLQDIMMEKEENSNGPNNFNYKIIDFLNCVLGNTY